MDAREYCELVEQQELHQHRQLHNIAVAEDNSPLISLKKAECDLVFEPSVIESYRYLVREAVFEKVGRIGLHLNREEKKLVIRSAWRSFAHQRLIWDKRVERLQRENPEVHHKEIIRMAAYFIAPETKSMHSTGGAVDALIYDVKNDCVMDFGTNDGLKIHLSRRCYPAHPDLTSEAKKNRRLLIDLFEDQGFTCDLMEFWHFDYGNLIWAVQKCEPHAKYGRIGEY
jgi:D-alanyl-D-alanine dipeptidase